MEGFGSDMRTDPWGASEFEGGSWQNGQMALCMQGTGTCVGVQLARPKRQEEGGQIHRLTRGFQACAKERALRVDSGRGVGAGGCEGVLLLASCRAQSAPLRGASPRLRLRLLGILGINRGLGALQALVALLVVVLSALLARVAAQGGWAHGMGDGGRVRLGARRGGDRGVRSWGWRRTAEAASQRRQRQSSGCTMAALRPRSPVADADAAVLGDAELAPALVVRPVAGGRGVIGLDAFQALLALVVTGSAATLPYGARRGAGIGVVPAVAGPGGAAAPVAVAVAAGVRPGGRAGGGACADGRGRHGGAGKGGDRPADLIGPGRREAARGGGRRAGPRQAAPHASASCSARVIGQIQHRSLPATSRRATRRQQAERMARLLCWNKLCEQPASRVE